MDRRLAPECRPHWPAFIARTLWSDNLKFDLETGGILLFRPVHHREKNSLIGIFGLRL